jgi:phage terminase large subunit-like protein
MQRQALPADTHSMMRLAGFEPDPWQQDLLRSSFTRQLLLCSRQSGKSTTTAFLALHEAIYRNNALVLMLSPSLRQSQELFRKALHAYSKLLIRPPCGQRKLVAP